MERAALVRRARLVMSAVRVPTLRESPEAPASLRRLPQRDIGTACWSDIAAPRLQDCAAEALNPNDSTQQSGSVPKIRPEFWTAAAGGALRAPAGDSRSTTRSEERRVGKECRAEWGRASGTE